MEETKTKRAVLPKGSKVVIPGAEHMTKEELEKAKKNETQRRLMARRSGKEPLERVTKQELRKIDTAEMVELAVDTRNLAVQVLNTKLQMINDDPDILAKTSIKELATVFGILFDKSQLLNGLSTSNINIHSKIDINMSSEKAIEELSKMAEHYQSENR